MNEPKTLILKPRPGAKSKNGKPLPTLMIKEKPPAPAYKKQRGSKIASGWYNYPKISG